MNSCQAYHIRRQENTANMHWDKTHTHTQKVLRATSSLITISSTNYYSTRKHSLAHNEPMSFSKKKKKL